jgi:hypothetical protein
MPSSPTAYLVVMAVPGANPPNMLPLVGTPPILGQSFQMLPVGNIMGRLPAPDITIVLPWHQISRRQTQIDSDGQGVWDIQDLTSRNGTFVNGQKLQPHAPWQLTEGDRIHLGQPGPPGTLEFLFTFTPQPPSPRPPQTYEEFLAEDEF